MNINMIKKITFFLILFTIIQPFSALASKNINILDNYDDIDFTNKNNNEVYGFVIIYPTNLEISKNPDIQYQTLNIINDLLRKNISVYWLSNDIEISTKKILSNEISYDKIIQKGSFFIPFTGNTTRNILSIVTISEYYNISSKIKNNILFLTEPIKNKNFLRLNEPKIAYYFDQGITIECIKWYMDSLSNAGFLNSEILDDINIISKLDDNNYNILIWPGGNMFEGFERDLSFFSTLQRQYSIKNFISKGGGYVGSCYGAFMASSGIRLTPFFLIQYYFPTIPTFGFFSLSDTLLSLGIPSTIDIKIESTDSPVTFGLNGTLNGSSLRGGPVYTWIGKNSESLAKIENINTSWFNWIETLNNSLYGKIFRKWVNFTIGKTVWVSSEYNEGKVVTFGDHPEHGDIKLQRAVHNSVLYVTSELINNTSFEKGYQFSYVETYLNESKKIIINENELYIFGNELNKIYNTHDILSSLEYQYDIFSNLVQNLTDNENIDISFYYQMMRGGLWRFRNFISDNLDIIDSIQDDEDIIDNIRNIDSIYYLLSNIDISTDDQIMNLKISINNRLDLINNSLKIIKENFSNIIFEIANYQNTTYQNQYIVNLSRNIEMQLIIVLDNLSSLYFDSVINSRDLSCTYKLYILMN